MYVLTVTDLTFRNNFLTKNSIKRNETQCVNFIVSLSTTAVATCIHREIYSPLFPL
jgi:hypothetical protein